MMRKQCLSILFFALLASSCDQKSSEAARNAEKPNQRSSPGRVDLKDQTSAIEGYLQATNTDERQRYIDAAKESLIGRSEQDLSKIITAGGQSDNSVDRVRAKIALDILFTTNPQLALDLFSGTNGLRGGLGLAFLELAVTTQPELVATWMMASDLGKIKHIIEPMMQAFANKNPSTGLSIIAAQKDSTVSRMMIDRFFAALPGKTDDAISLVSKYFKDDLADFALITISRKHAAKDPLGALDAIAKMGGFYSTRKNEVLKGVFESLISKNPEYFLPSLEQLNPGALQTVLGSKLVLEHVIASDPATAINLIDSLVMTSQNSGLFKNAAFALAQRSPDLALNWINQLQPSDTRNVMLSNACKIWSEKSPLEVVKAIESIKGPGRSAALEGLAVGWATGSIKDFEQALTWSNNLSADEKRVFLGSGFSRLSSRYPEEAAKLLSEAVLNQLDPQVARGAVVATTRSLAEKNMNEAKAWITKIPEAHQPAAVRGMVMEWVKTDAHAASAWLSNFSPGMSRDAGAEVLANAIQTTDPELAKQWRASMQK